MRRRRRWCRSAALVIGFCITSVARGADEDVTPADIPRFALVVGVQNYDLYTEVPNALNDARRIAEALLTANFEVAFLGNPQTNDEIVVAAGALAEKAAGEPADFALFFAGHGFQEGAFNFLVPAKARTGADLMMDSVPVATVLQAIAGRRTNPRPVCWDSGGAAPLAGVAVVMLDACRTSGHVRSPEEPTSPSGFTSLSVSQGTIVGLAAKFNRPALSRVNEGDANSPYSSALADHLPREAITVEEVFKRVQADVEVSTRDEQSPETVNALAGAFRFRPTADERASEEAEWRAALATNNCKCIVRFLKRFPDSRFVGAALAWMTGGGAPGEGVEQCPGT